MPEQCEVINVDVDEKDNKPVTINCENGSTVTVNVNIRNYYGFPEWFDRSAFDAIIETLRGRG